MPGIDTLLKRPRRLALTGDVAATKAEWKSVRKIVPIPYLHHIANFMKCTDKIVSTNMPKPKEGGPFESDFRHTGAPHRAADGSPSAVGGASDKWGTCMEKLQKVVKKLPDNCLSCRFLDDSDLPNFFCDVTCEMLNATGTEEIDQKRHETCPLVLKSEVVK